MSDTDIHSCGYYCDHPACIKRQRDELRDKLFSNQAVKTYSGGKPNYTQPIVQEPVAYLCENAVGHKYFRWKKPQSIFKPIGLYTAPPQPNPEPVVWKVWTVHNHIFFSIGVQTFQINDVLEHEPEVSAKEFSEWLVTQLRHALTQLSNTAPPQRDWVGLTDDEYETMAEQYVTNCYFDTLKFAKAIEVKLKDKNNG